MMGVYVRQDGASAEVYAQRELVDAAYEARNSGGNAYYEYQRELTKLDEMTK
jgi:hypothetical protein